MEVQKSGPSVRAERGRSVADRCRMVSPLSLGPVSSEILHSGLSKRLLSGAFL